MKKLFLLLAIPLILGAGCVRPVANPTTSPRPAPYGAGATSTSPLPANAPEGMALEPASQFGAILRMNVGDTLWFPDGLSVTLESIGDSRCSGRVQCLWAGELSPTLLLKKEAPETWSKEIRLGTATAPQVKEGPYVFNLKNATAADIVLSVEKP